MPNWPRNKKIIFKISNLLPIKVLFFFLIFVSSQLVYQWLTIFPLKMHATALHCCHINFKFYYLCFSIRRSKEIKQQQQKKTRNFIQFLRQSNQTQQTSKPNSHRICQSQNGLLHSCVRSLNRNDLCRQISWRLIDVIFMHVCIYILLWFSSFFFLFLLFLLPFTI